MDDDQDNPQGDENTKLSSAAQGHDPSTAASNWQACNRIDGAQTPRRLDREQARGKDFKACKCQDFGNGRGRRARSALTQVDATLGESVEA